MDQRLAECINLLGRFCGKRDVPELTPEVLSKAYGIRQADVMVLFGGSILAGGDIFAKAIQNRIAKRYLLVGGEGHTTEALRQTVHREHPEIETAGLPEAEMFQRYLRRVYGVEADGLETQSTNCGNNITNLLDFLRKEKITCKSIILCQDATMQTRMDAGLRKYVPQDVTVINYAAYAATVTVRGTELAFTEEIHGMWTPERYLQLLMGEIPRLTDDKNGYGPNGRQFIAHVEIPEQVTRAYKELTCVYGAHPREANPLYASKKDRIG